MRPIPSATFAWPFERSEWKSGVAGELITTAEAKRMLEKAAALLIAEWDRLDRLAVVAFAFAIDPPAASKRTQPRRHSFGHASGEGWLHWTTNEARSLDLLWHPRLVQQGVEVSHYSKSTPESH